MYLGFDMTDARALLFVGYFLLILGVLMTPYTAWHAYRRWRRELFQTDPHTPASWDERIAAWLKNRRSRKIANRELAAMAIAMERRRRAAIFLSNEKLRKNCDPVAFRRPIKRY